MAGESVQRTIYGAHLQTCQYLKKPFTVLANSTLNQKFNVASAELPAANEYPTFKGIVIGNDGAKVEVLSGDKISITPKIHLPRHSALYNHIPFIVRKMSEDLSSSERLLYRLRQPFTKDGVEYVAYFMKVVNIDTTAPLVELLNVNNGAITSQIFSPTLSDLSPTPPTLNSVSLVQPNGDYLSSTGIVMLTLNSNDINEIITACGILYGNVKYATISEIGICHGVDRIVNGGFGSVTAPYTESIATQIAGFVYQFYSLNYGADEININLELGSKEPLLV